jgi:hypothetical protein
MDVQEIKQILSSVESAMYAEDVDSLTVGRVINRIIYGSPDGNMTERIDNWGEELDRARRDCIARGWI